jgi:DNA-binding transcriptional ArsR family regulator
LPVDTTGRAVIAKFFRALGDPTRLRLLEFVLTDEKSVSECVEFAGLAQGRVSSHLACLADCGLVQVRREGRFGYYRVVDPRTADLVLLARSLAADNARSAECLRAHRGRDAVTSRQNGRDGRREDSAGPAAESRPRGSAQNRRWSLLSAAVLLPVLLLALVAVRGLDGGSSGDTGVASTTTAGVDLVPGASAAGQLEQGVTVPEFSVSTLSGATFRMPSGQPTVLTFVNLCPTCIGDTRTIGALQQRFADVAVLAVVTDPTADAARVQHMQQAGDPPFALALDPDSALTRAFDAFSKAASVVVTDRSGRITYRGPAEEEALVSALRAAGARG